VERHHGRVRRLPRVRCALAGCPCHCPRLLPPPLLSRSVAVSFTLLLFALLTALTAMRKVRIGRLGIRVGDIVPRSHLIIAPQPAHEHLPRIQPAYAVSHPRRLSVAQHSILEEGSSLILGNGYITKGALVPTTLAPTPMLSDQRCGRAEIFGYWLWYC
jgi:hypothetical protein